MNGEKKTKIKKSLFHLKQGGNPVEMSEMLRTVLNVSGFSCHRLVKVYVKGCSMFCFSKIPHYLLFCTR